MDCIRRRVSSKETVSCNLCSCKNQLAREDSQFLSLSSKRIQTRVNARNLTSEHSRNLSLICLPTHLPTYRHLFIDLRVLWRRPNWRSALRTLSGLHLFFLQENKVNINYPLLSISNIQNLKSQLFYYSPKLFL